MRAAVINKSATTYVNITTLSSVPAVKFMVHEASLQMDLILSPENAKVIGAALIQAAEELGNKEEQVR